AASLPDLAAALGSAAPRRRYRTQSLNRGNLMRRDDEDDDRAGEGGDQETGIEVSLGFFPLAWVFFFCTPRIAIDGRDRQRSWGSHFFSVPPGRHDVEVWVPYLFWSRCGFNSRRVEVHEGETAHVSFYMWPFVLLPGAMSVRYGA